jgi:hypothetical protein
LSSFLLWNNGLMNCVSNFYSVKKIKCCWCCDLSCPLVWMMKNIADTLKSLCSFIVRLNKDGNVDGKQWNSSYLTHSKPRKWSLPTVEGQCIKSTNFPFALMIV